MQTRDLPRVFVGVKETVYNPEWVQALQIENMLQILEIVARASLMRKESRGAMYRKDYPNTDNKNWLRNIVVQQKDGKMTLSTRPIIVTKVKPPKPAVIPYWVTA